MNVHDKINFRADAVYYLSAGQYMQLVKRDLMSLAPYYSERLKRQEEGLREYYCYVGVYGKSRWVLENGL